MSLNFNSFNIGGSNGGGGNPANYLPSGTVINVKTDGSGDYTNLKDTLDYLKGKWSDGIITIQFGDGTFSHTQQISVNGQDFNIPWLDIVGNGADKTIIEFTTAVAQGVIALYFQKGINVSFRNLKIYRPSGDKTTDYRGFELLHNTYLDLQNVSFEGCNYAVASNIGCTTAMRGTISFDKCNICLSAHNGHILSHWAAVNTFNDCNTAYSVSYGGQIHLTNATSTYTDVTTKTTQSVGSATANGWITGVTV